ncbi:alkaline phosphatase [Alkalihalobacillus alcalophilus ATCC 27647 = CGMCC 1.3604]|uniref:histidine kinase n=1 Tax=Alkalihalobacillus alcalophilus ATCC 27647 = CGMCC 1.3604 TaxID=1218173 RepID=A0A094WPC4_ALKAL|nr:ATP-binding protein [Alkalihalobacillus alcalophilus]KGA97848.1 alkaline phosphatase [Alkalihalobacillus alcalophilus ATCC 27647 = CGMCC 1.3604]MED1563874.1 ATP-binding protein [Alkalihalobacillus alcalophilus]THG91094.1 alkaline phosphatase [Alkalihalobacillus alcalophilus ATCC 27647 = CGMCC 1.3604]
MVKLRFRLMISVMLTILLVLAGLGVAIGQLFKEFHLDYTTERLENDAKLVAFLIEENSLLDDNIQEFTNNVSHELDVRVTIILSDGEVIGESSTDPELMENHLERPEIIELLTGESGKQIRYSTTVENELLYMAVPVMEGSEKVGIVRLGLPTSDIHAMNRNMWTFLIISFSLAAVVIFLVIYRITSQMIRPIESVTDVANELAKGNFKARTVEGNQDEIGQLTKSVNVLASNLEHITNRHQLQKERMETLIENMGSGLILINMRGDISLINKTCRDIFQENTDKWDHKLYHDVIGHKEIIQLIQSVFMTEEKIRKQITFEKHLEIKHYDVHGAPVISHKGSFKGIALVMHDITELKKLEQVRKDFVANVSHELKTPVTSIKGFSETLLDGAMHDEAYREKFLHIIWKESERLQGLIHDLLELSKIEQHFFQLNWSKLNMAVAVEEAVTLLKEKALDKSIQLEMHLEGHFEMEGDFERIKQIAINLISNAITYTPAEGKIDVYLKGYDDFVEWKVEDTGIGISEQECPRIFERFYRVDRARSRNSGGTGLGLAIVKHLVEAHHAQIEVESELGKGTTFSMKFKREHEEDWELDLREEQ